MRAAEIRASHPANLPRLDPKLLRSFLLEERKLDPGAKPSAADCAAALKQLFPTEKHPDGVPHLENFAARDLRELYAKLMDTDQFRIMLGRIAASYDGGQILND